LGFSPQISNFPSQQGSPPSRIYCQKSNLCIFNLIDRLSNHFLSASASCYFSNLLWLYIYIYILWGPKNGLQQSSQYIPMKYFCRCLLVDIAREYFVHKIHCNSLIEIFRQHFHLYNDDDNLRNLINSWWKCNQFLNNLFI